MIECVDGVLTVARLVDPKYVGAVGTIPGNPFLAGRTLWGDGDIRSLANDLLMTVAGHELNMDETENEED